MEKLPSAADDEVDHRPTDGRATTKPEPVDPIVRAATVAARRVDVAIACIGIP